MDIQRENRIDLLRGLSLLLIFIGHAEFSFSPTFQQSRGFSDASEIFVLLAGMSSALAYYRPAAGLRLATPWKRAFRLYLVHLLLFAIMAAVSAALLGIVDQSDWTFDMTAFWKNPLLLGTQALLLTYMPGNLDILPMYVVLLLCVPFIFWLHDRSKPVLLAVSAFVWFSAGLGHVNLPNAALEGQRWYFDPLSWQLIFVIGVVLGIRMKRGEVVLPYDRAIFAAAAFFAIAAVPLNLAVHLALIEPPFGELHHQLVSKTNSGPLRIANILAITYLAWNMPMVKKAADHPGMRLFCIMGRHSLPVFSAGILLSFGAMVMMRVKPEATIAPQLLLLLCGCALQLWLGRVLEQRRQRSIPPGHPAPASSAVPEDVPGGMMVSERS